MKSKRYASLITLFLISTVFVAAQKYESDAFALSILEGQGRFSIASKSDGETTPLFVAEDLSTTYFKLLLNDRIYVLGDSFAFRQKSALTESGGSITWSSSRISVQLDINIEHASYVTVDAIISNLAEVKQDVGLRLLLDTYLGEQGDHFLLPTGPVKAEIELTNIPEYIQSGNSDPIRLYLIYDSYGATKPDRIVLANWKRLDEVNWGYTINTNRSFNYSPYSINDSAVSSYFEPVELASGESRSIRIVLATDLPGSGPADALAQSSLAETSVSSVSNANARIIGSKVTTINDLIKKIDELLKAGRDPTEEELILLQSAIESIKEQYAQTQ